ncbi:MAG TPA: M1 family aminopeptidase, partial [Calditrichia bacterium]|nr:M1 family aminopeptidase [Calditrichia bacterium]
DIFLVRDPHRWYPFTGSRLRADFDMTFTYPRGMDLAGIGEVVERDTLEERVRERRVTREAAPLATFNIGFFDTLAVSRNGLPEIVVQTYAPEVRRNSPLGKREEPGDARNVKAQVAEDVAASLAFFQDKMGPLPLRRLLVSEIPYRHGAAFPGLLLLSWMTFEMTGTKGIDEAFRAHEVAHQYWGIGVDARSYHDAWLSEGMAEFWGWQVARRRLLEKDPPNGEKRYRDFLKDWRENIIEKRRFLFGDGQEAAPIWLGHRTHSTETEGDYTLIIYKKGAWVLNMLETLWQLKETPGPDFEAFLGEFYRRHRGGRVTTEQFIAAAEAAYGDSLQWFFDQWVYGTDLPLYRLSGDIRNGGE